MNSLLRTGLAALAMLFAMSAHASVFSFTYTFQDQTILTGTLEGTVDGNYVKDLSNIQVVFNNTAFTGQLLQAAYNPGTQLFDLAGGAKLSADAMLNNFVFADSDPGTAFPNNYFYFVNDAALGQEVFAVNYNSGDVALDNPAAGTWTLKAEVPEPATLALTLGALGLMGAVRRRRA